MTMTKEEIERELDRCGNDFEYMLRTYCYIMTNGGGRRRPTEEEIARLVLVRKYPQVRPKFGCHDFADPVRVLRALPQWLRPTAIVHISHYQ